MALHHYREAAVSGEQRRKWNSCRTAELPGRQVEPGMKLVRKMTNKNTGQKPSVKRRGRALSKAMKKKSAVRREQKNNLENTEGLNENTCVQKNTQSDGDNQTRADTMFRRRETRQVNKGKVLNMRGRPGCGESRRDKQTKWESLKKNRWRNKNTRRRWQEGAAPLISKEEKQTWGGGGGGRWRGHK